jgi:fatty-acyl-CoA synthase
LIRVEYDDFTTVRFVAQDGFVLGLTMDYALTVDSIVRRAETLYAHKEVVTRRPDRSLHRTTYGDVCRRARALGSALSALGVRRGDRVATLCWNTVEHLEAYLGVPSAGAVVHTLNLRLHAEDIAWIAGHAGDRVLIVDESLLPLAEQVVPHTSIEHVIVVGDEYEELVARGDPAAPAAALDENEAAAMCYTSGTTARPKGVLYSHRALVLHSLASLANGLLGIGERDVVLPVVPMFHANAWGLPYTATLAGASLVLPGPHLDPQTLVETLESEIVTITGGVPTIWLGILQLLDSDPGRYDLSALRSMIVGGSAAPRALIEGFERRHGLHVCHAWGMTELAPLGTVAEPPSGLAGAGEEERFAFRSTQGVPAPLVELRARGEDGALVPWDAETMGELEVRGVWIASAYYDAPEAADRWTDDGWFRTGDIVTIDGHGAITIQDRSKDVIKSGGEWISSVALENALMAHPAVAEAAVIGVADERWQERPLAAVVLRGEATADELRDFLARDFAKWQLPERFEFMEEIPKTAVGKFRKTALRERFATPAGA